MIAADVIAVHPGSEIIGETIAWDSQNDMNAYIYIYITYQQSLLCMLLPVSSIWCYGVCTRALAMMLLLSP